MNSDIYQQGIKSLAAARLACEPLERPDAQVTLDNPLCGDRVTVAIKLQEGGAMALSYKVKGCLLCQAAMNAIGAAASEGSSLSGLDDVAEQLSSMLKGESTQSRWPPKWQSLALFEPVAAHKNRHSCVLLPFKAVAQAQAVAVKAI